MSPQFMPCSCVLMQVPIILAAIYLICMLYLLVVKFILYPLETFLGIVLIICASVVVFYLCIVPKNPPRIIKKWEGEILSLICRLLWN